MIKNVDTEFPLESEAVSVIGCVVPALRDVPAAGRGKCKIVLDSCPLLAVMSRNLPIRTQFESTYLTVSFIVCIKQDGLYQLAEIQSNSC